MNSRVPLNTDTPNIPAMPGTTADYPTRDEMAALLAAKADAVLTDAVTGETVRIIVRDSSIETQPTT